MIALLGKSNTQKVEIYSLDESTYCASWASSQYLTEEKNQPPIPLSDNSIRQIVHISTSGNQIRVKFSNRCGNGDLVIKKARIANSASEGSGEIVYKTNKLITFGGYEEVTIPAGEEMYSDTFSYTLEAQSQVAVTIFFGYVPKDITSHAGSRTFSFIEKGNKVEEEKFSSEIKIDHWYVLTAIEVSSTPTKKCVVCFGDSITDGRGSTNDKQDRWTDRLALKLYKNEETSDLAVVNEGIGATFVSTSGVERFERDVLEIKGAKYIVMLYGVNDILFLNANSSLVINTYKSLIKRAHKSNLFIYGTTILPFGTNDNYTPERDKVREEINEWIRTTKPEDGGFDTYFDFDKYMRDPDKTNSLAPEYDCGDGLHPSANGYEWMVNAIEDLAFFTKEPEFNQADYLQSLKVINTKQIKFKLPVVAEKDNIIFSKIDFHCLDSDGFRVWGIDNKGEKASEPIYIPCSSKKANVDIESYAIADCYYLLITGPREGENITNITFHKIEIKIGENRKMYSPADEAINAENISIFGK